MPGLGTAINVGCIVAGGLVGLLGGRLLTERVRDGLLKACGLCVLFVGMAGALEEMLVIDGAGLASTGSMMAVVSLAVGTVVGELLDIDGRFERLGTWLRARVGGDGDATFVEGFVSASLTVCVGAMAVVGSIQDGLSGDWSTLALKGALDAVIVCSMTAALGRGCVFSALPVAVLQGAVTALAVLVSPLMTDAALANLSLVGSMLVFCVGVNLVRPGTFRPAGMLPSVVVAAALAFVM